VSATHTQLSGGTCSAIKKLRCAIACERRTTRAALDKLPSGWMAGGKTAPLAEDVRAALINSSDDLTITMLSLSKIMLRQFPIARLSPSITQLDLSSNPLLGASAEGLSTRLPALHTLSLAHAQLTAIPRGLSTCRALRTLDLSGNALGGSSAERRSLVSQRDALPRGLTRLSLADNALCSVPAAVWRLAALETLELHNNQLSELRSEIEELVALKVLRLGNNQFDKLPSQLGWCEALTQLGFLGNPIVWPPEQVRHSEYGHSEHSQSRCSIMSQQKRLAASRQRHTTGR